LANFYVEEVRQFEILTRAQESFGKIFEDKVKDLGNLPDIGQACLEAVKGWVTKFHHHRMSLSL
jgi:hypothetical protein